MTDQLETVNIVDGWEVALVQATDLAINVRQSPKNGLVGVVRLSTGQPVRGATVELYGFDDQPFWKGRTDNDGLAKTPAFDDPRCAKTNCSVTALVFDGEDFAYEATEVPPSIDGNISFLAQLDNNDVPNPDDVVPRRHRYLTSRLVDHFRAALRLARERSSRGRPRP